MELYDPRPADTMARLAGALMVVSGLTNMLFAAVWVLALVWLCVGVFWLLPLAFGAVEVVAGMSMLALGRHSWPGGLLGLIGSFSAALCFNPISVVLDLSAAALSVATAMHVSRREERAW